MCRDRRSIERDRRAANDDARVGLAVPHGVLDRGIDARRHHREGEADHGPRSPTCDDFAAIFVGGGIAVDRRAPEPPGQRDVVRHRRGILGQHRAQDLDIDARARSGVDDLVHVAGIVIPLSLEGGYPPPHEPLHHDALLPQQAFTGRTRWRRRM